MTDNISLRTTVCMNARCFLHTCLTCSSNLSNNSKPHQINFRPDQSQVWSESIMEEPEGVLKHKLKVYAYRKTRRLLRIGRRKAGHDPRWYWWWWMIGVVTLFCWLQIIVWRSADISTRGRWSRRSWWGGIEETKTGEEQRVEKETRDGEMGELWYEASTWSRGS